jgi:hypothetical protein
LGGGGFGGHATGGLGSGHAAQAAVAAHAAAAQATMAARAGAIHGAARDATAHGHMAHMQTMRFAAVDSRPHHPPQVPRNESNTEPGSDNLSRGFSHCASFAADPDNCGFAKKQQVDPRTGMPIG